MSSRRCLRAATRCRARRPLERASATTCPRARSWSRRTCASRGRAVRRGAPRGASISARRSTCACRWSGRRTTPTSTCSARQRARGRAPPRPQVVFARPAGRSTGSATAPPQRTPSAGPLSPYGASKLAGEEYLAAYNRLYGTRQSRCASATSTARGRTRTARRAWSRSSSGSSRQAEPPTIFGDGSQTRDYVFVGDVARATLAAAGQDGGVFNVGTGEETSVLDLYELCRRAAGSELEAEFSPPRSASSSAACSTSRARSASLAGAPEVPLEDGFRRTWESIGRPASGRIAPRAANRTIRHGARPSDTAWYHPWRTIAVVDRRDRHPRAARARDRRRHADRQARDASCPVRSSSRAVERNTRRRSRSLPLLPRGSTSVTVLNGNGRSGAAAAQASRVRARGISSATSGTRLGWATDAA